MKSLIGQFYLATGVYQLRTKERQRQRLTRVERLVHRGEDGTQH